MLILICILKMDRVGVHPNQQHDSHFLQQTLLLIMPLQLCNTCKSAQDEHATAGAAPAQGVADKTETRNGKALQLLKPAAATLVCSTRQDAAS